MIALSLIAFLDALPGSTRATVELWRMRKDRQK